MRPAVPGRSVRVFRQFGSALNRFLSLDYPTSHLRPPSPHQTDDSYFSQRITHARRSSGDLHAVMAGGLPVGTKPLPTWKLELLDKNERTRGFPPF